MQTGAIPVTTSCLEEQLRNASFAPSVTMSIQHIAAIPFIVAASDMVAIVPRELHELFSHLVAMKTVRRPKVSCVRESGDNYLDEPQRPEKH